MSKYLILIFYFRYVHSFISYNCLSLRSTEGGGWGQSPVTLGESLQVCHMANTYSRARQNVHTVNLESSLSLTFLSLDCRRKLDYPEETHMQTPHREASLSVLP